ncbi:13550_t:CDS:2 [Ambispora leptoticha]|uniref:13550_t:CDS:1 n=1 Tax=Ambispora leptoticha TaxID=144679 RepID=A0A9N8W0K7_9GLOM|nr:13550_t:CDS:2 [Ambispora leptoticha]
MDSRHEQIRKAINEADLKMLKKIATTGPGLINSDFRRECWPLLLHCTFDDEKRTKGRAEDISLKDRHQVEADINRSFVHFPKGISSIEKTEKIKQLQEVIITVLKRHPDISYYQGFHDVCSFLLLILGEETAINVAEQIVMGPLRDAARESLEPFMRNLTLVGELVKKEDAQLYNFLVSSEVFPEPISCISWLMTWCSHNVYDLDKLARIFDYMIASNAQSTCAYFTAAVILSRKSELLAINDDDCSLLHVHLGKFPQDANIDYLIEKAVSLQSRYSPEDKLNKLFSLLLVPKNFWHSQIEEIREKVSGAVKTLGWFLFGLQIAIKQALDAFDGRSLPITYDQETEHLVWAFLTERKVLRKLFVKKYNDHRIANDTRELAEEYEDLIQKLLDIATESDRQNKHSASKSEQLTENLKTRRTIAGIVSGAAIVAAPLTSGASLIAAALASTVAVHANEKIKAEAKKTEIVVNTKSKLIEKISNISENVKQFEIVWRGLADEAVLQKENTADDPIINKDDLKLKWEEMYEMFKSYANNAQRRLDDASVIWIESGAASAGKSIGELSLIIFSLELILSDFRYYVTLLSRSYMYLN